MLKSFKISSFRVLLLSIVVCGVFCSVANADPGSAGVLEHIQDSEGDLLNLPGSGIIMGTVASTGVPSQQDTSPVTPPPLQPPCYMKCPCGPAIPCGSDVSRCEKPAYCGNGIFAPCGQPCPPLICEGQESSKRVVSSDGIKSSSVQRVSSNVRSSSLQVVSSSRRESSRALPVSQSTTTSQGSRECGFNECTGRANCNTCCDHSLDCCNAVCIATIPSTGPTFNSQQQDCRADCLVDSNNCNRSCTGTGSCDTQGSVSCWNAMINILKSRFNMTDADVKAFGNAAGVIMENCYVNRNTGRLVTDSDICGLWQDVAYYSGISDKDTISNRIEEWLAQWEQENKGGGLPDVDFGRCARTENESLCKSCCANENLTCWTTCDYAYSEQSQILSCRNNCDEKHGICENSCGNKLGSSSKALQSSSLKSVSHISSPLAVSSSVKQSSSLRAVSSSRVPSSSKMWSSSLRLSSSNVLSSAAVPECDRDVCHKDCQEKLPACVEAMYGDFNTSLLSNLVRSHSVCTNELTACQTNCRDKVKNPDCQVIFEPCKTDVRRAACGAEICMNEDNRETECKRRGYQGADLDDCKKNITCSCDSDCKPSFDYTRKEASSASLKRSSLLKSSSRISSSRVVSSSKKQSSSLRLSSTRAVSSSRRQSSYMAQQSSIACACSYQIDFKNTNTVDEQEQIVTQQFSVTNIKVQYQDQNCRYYCAPNETAINPSKRKFTIVALCSGTGLQQLGEPLIIQYTFNNGSGKSVQGQQSYTPNAEVVINCPPIINSDNKDTTCDSPEECVAKTASIRSDCHLCCNNAYTCCRKECDGFLDKDPMAWQLCQDNCTIVNLRGCRDRCDNKPITQSSSLKVVVSSAIPNMLARSSSRVATSSSSGSKIGEGCEIALCLKEASTLNDCRNCCSGAFNCEYKRCQEWDRQGVWSMNACLTNLAINNKGCNDSCNQRRY